MEMKRITVPFEMKQVSEEGEFEGFASTFGNVDFDGDVVERGAFVDDLKEWKAKGQLPLMPWQHDMRALVGDFLSMDEVEKGLFVKGQFWVGSKSTDLSKMAHNLFVGTGPKAMSIGFSVLDSEVKLVDGERVRSILKVKLFEVSIVPFGANPEALVTSSKSLVTPEGIPVDKRSFEKILRDAGLSCKQAKTLLSGGYSALNRDDEMNELLAAIKTLSNSIQGK